MFRIYRFLLSIDTFKTLILFLFIHEIYGHFIFYVIEYFGYVSSLNSTKFESIFEDVFTSVLIAPFTETLFAQIVLYSLLKKITKKTFLVYLMASLFFASLQTYSLLYVFATFFSGLCYIILYSILLRKSKSVAFLGVFLFMQ